MKPELDPRFKRGEKFMGEVARDVTVTELEIALRESVKLQAHYATLLNMHDGGHRMVFPDADAWIARLRETGTLPRR